MTTSAAYPIGTAGTPWGPSEIAAWQDESHVVENRARYREKFERVLPWLAEAVAVEQPAGGFYLWPQIGGDDIEACERLLGEAGVLTLPGSFLARTTTDGNPGRGRLRLALVAGEEECVEAAKRMRDVLIQRGVSSNG